MASWRRSRAAAAHRAIRRGVLPEVLVDPARDLRDGSEGRGEDPLGPVRLPNERDFMRYLTAYIMPSIHALSLTPEALAAVPVPVLTVHGTKDRSARDWASLLPNARLLTVECACHGPWIEAPEAVCGLSASSCRRRDPIVIRRRSALRRLSRFECKALKHWTCRVTVGHSQLTIVLRLRGSETGRGGRDNGADRLEPAFKL
jgi:hypothetical protein